jgi:hypothetical protein
MAKQAKPREGAPSGPGAKGGKTPPPAPRGKPVRVPVKK